MKHATMFKAIKQWKLLTLPIDNNKAELKRRISLRENAKQNFNIDRFPISGFSNRFYKIIWIVSAF